MSEEADVVISGAGPNGLMLACELALAGVRPVVLDKLPGPSDELKANGLVGQVIRQLDLRGLYHAFGGDDGPPRPSYGWMFAGIPWTSSMSRTTRCTLCCSSSRAWCVCWRSGLAISASTSGGVMS